MYKTYKNYDEFKTAFMQAHCHSKLENDYPLKKYWDNYGKGKGIIFCDPANIITNEDDIDLEYNSCGPHRCLFKWVTTDRTGATLFETYTFVSSKRRD